MLCSVRHERGQREGRREDPPTTLLHRIEELHVAVIEVGRRESMTGRCTCI